MGILLEVCVDSIESAIAARQGGADRIEICGSLVCGGVTPSAGFVRRCVTDVGLPVMMMVRPRDGDFVYRDDEVEIMLSDIEYARSLDIRGVVFGALTPDGRIHEEHCRRLLAAAQPLQTTFHRAFDVAADAISSFDTIVQLGFDRLLTSGRSPRAGDGLAMIGRLHGRARGRIGIIPGSGVDAGNVSRIVAATGVREVHASGSAPAGEKKAIGAVRFGPERRVTSEQRVRAIRRALDEGAAIDRP